jgi:hypothetical protein
MILWKRWAKHKQPAQEAARSKQRLPYYPDFYLAITFKLVHVNLENQVEYDPGTGVLGMDILKRFNTIIDYQNNLIYLNHNSMIKAPFKRYQHLNGQ